MVTIVCCKAHPIKHCAALPTIKYLGQFMTSRVGSWERSRHLLLPPIYAFLSGKLTARGFASRVIYYSTFLLKFQRGIHPDTLVLNPLPAEAIPSNHTFCQSSTYKISQQTKVQQRSSSRLQINHTIQNHAPLHCRV